MKIAIAGYGIEGKASLNYWNTGEHEITIADERTDVEVPNGVKSILGPDAFGTLNGFDLVIRTASLPPSHIKTDGKIWSATNEFFAKCPAPIIGVTGTKGKGTTCSMIVSILRAAGKTVHLVGNIGTPALEVLPNIRHDDIVVFELSSFQLWDLEKSPSIGICLLVEPDHLNVHSDMHEYVEAKANIAKYQVEDDAFFFHPTNTYAADIALQTIAHVNTRYNQAEDMPSVYYDAHDFCYRGRAICSLDALGLRGEHNKENACAALSVAKYLGVENVAIEEGLRSFKGLPHRLEFVRDVEGVLFFDDSFSSAPPAVVVAVNAFTEPVILICGGYDRGLAYENMAQSLANSGNVKKVLAVGETKDKIIAACETQNIHVEGIGATTMDEIVASAQRSAESGDIVILSPGCASFDMFKNFIERGEKFQKAVQKL